MESELLRIRIIEAARDLVKYGLVVLEGGNISARDKDTGLILITPSGLPYDTMRPEDVVAVDLNSSIPYQKPKSVKPSPEHETAYLKAKELINEQWSKFHKESHKSIGYFDLITESIYTMQMKLTQFAIEKYKPDVLIEISKDSCEIFGFHRAEEMIEYGRKQFISVWAENKNKFK